MKATKYQVYEESCIMIDDQEACVFKNKYSGNWLIAALCVCLWLKVHDKKFKLEFY